MMKKPKYLIFDCDGVLVDSELIAGRVEAEVKTELGFKTTLEEQLQKFVGLGMNNPTVQEELRRLPSGYWEMIDERLKVVYETELKAVAHVAGVLEKIDQPKCVASSSHPDWLKSKLSITRLARFFGGAVFSGHSVKRGKPEPDLFLFAAEKMGWDPGECLVIEDSEPGVRAGLAAGMRVCGFLGGSHIFPGHADRLLKAGAKTLISDMRELINII